MATRGPFEDLEGLVERMVSEAEAEWPQLAVERESFKAHLSTVLGLASDASSLRVADLYLAYGCQSGDALAVKAFAEKYMPRVALYLHRFARVVSVDDVRRELEDILLLGRNGSRPRLAAYQGRGPLENFVAVAALNVARTLLRGRKTAVSPAEDPASTPSPTVDATKGVVASRYDSIVREAVRAALKSLDRRQRMIVRLHLARGVTLTQIGRMLKVHQSTVSRALEGALDHLHVEIRRELREVHGLSDMEMDSIVRDVRSVVQLSLSRILQDTDTDP